MIRSAALSLLVLTAIGCGASDSSEASGAALANGGSSNGSNTTGAGGAGGTGGAGASTKAAAPYPIVFMHGMMGFDKLQHLPIDLVYFKGVKEILARRGETQVFITVVPPIASSEARVEKLKPQIDAILAQTGAAKVNLIGHSQGGLDARVLASPNGAGYGDRVASVTTIATPHLGSRVADLALGLLQGIPDNIKSEVANTLLQVMEDAVYSNQTKPDLLPQATELTERFMKQTFNPKFVDDARVSYFSYGGRTNLQTGEADCKGAAFPDDTSKVDVTQPMLLPTTVFLEGGIRFTNDGLVTVESARWGKFMQCVPADHLKEVGHLEVTKEDPVSKFDSAAFFTTVVERIRNEGF